MPPIVRGDHNEPETIFKAYEENDMDVTMTKVNVAIKINNVPESPEEKPKDSFHSIFSWICYSLRVVI